jgi:conjugal transfer pilus assembly protein TraW
MKHLGNCSFFLRTEHWMLITAFLGIEHCLLNSAQAKNFGVHGTIYPIEEQDPIALIQQKLKEMEKRGELEQHNKKLQKKTKEAVERPKPAQGITKAKKSRIFYFDPTYVVKEDIRDHIGKIIYFKGTKINPLETVNLSYFLLFIDGDDEQQKNWAKEKIQEACNNGIESKDFPQSCPGGNIPKIILVKGAPLSLAEEWTMPVYFDQAGNLTKKLGIKHIPALVTQEKKLLRIEEIYLSEIHPSESYLSPPPKVDANSENGGTIRPLIKSKEAE